MADKQVLLACPECGLVSVYSESNVHMTLSARLDRFQARECHLVFLEVECGDKNCEAQAIVHTIIGTDKGIWKQKVVPKDWHFGSDCLCEKGHRLAPDWSENRIAWEELGKLF